jgi:hypothetical protein
MSFLYMFKTVTRRKKGMHREINSHLEMSWGGGGGEISLDSADSSFCSVIMKKQIQQDLFLMQEEIN